MDIITAPALFEYRRKLIKSALVCMGGFATSGVSPALCALNRDYLNELQRLASSADISLDYENLTDFKSITTYNNYYEFSTDKKAVSFLAQELDTSGWSIEITGLVTTPLTLNIADLLQQELVQRTYRLRCIEGWSMVIPWVGLPLQRLLDAVNIKPEANFVRFESVLDPKAMIGQRRDTLDWPYVEALRLDEAKNPLTLLALGLYEKALTKQNGAPVRLVVPWKYGFKSIKAIKKIELTAEQPLTTWMKAAPNEYGFYANVHPGLAHPRWSQRREVRIGETKKRKTLMYNGYGDYVAHLYSGMSKAEHF